MTIGPFVALSCSVIGCVSGAAAGARHSALLGVLGGGLGLLLGTASFWGLAVPYVGWQTQREARSLPGPLPAPGRIWTWLFLPLIFTALALAALLPRFLIEWMAR